MLNTVRTLLVTNNLKSNEVQYTVYFNNNTEQKAFRKDYLFLKPFFKESTVGKNDGELYETLFYEINKEVYFDWRFQKFLLVEKQVS